MNRRSFIASILAAGVAPAFIGARVLMPVKKVWTLPGGWVIGAQEMRVAFGAGIANEYAAYQASVSYSTALFASAVRERLLLDRGVVVV